MADKDKLVPRSPNEVVVPVGRANLVTTQEEIDEALKTASHIFKQNNEEEEVMQENNLNEELQTSLEIDETEVSEVTVETNDNLELVELSDDELAALPYAKFGRDSYGRALNKNGTPRKARNDKGQVRGAYGPRTSKTETTKTAPQVAIT